MDLQTWIADDHASVLQRFDNAIGVHVPTDRWKDTSTGSSIAWLLFHMTLHQDLALNTAVRDHAPIVVDHRDALGISAIAPSAGLTEAEDSAVTAALDLSALRSYVTAVNDATAAWIAKISIMALDSVPTSSWRLEHKAGVPAAGDFAWLHAMWTDKPVSWLVQWECIGHGHAHVGEMVGIRNRLGLSPF
ncbi:MAG: hypothetical protein JWM34_2687 [Ilumatobacteraceae bacterium]|nr:hypothetical protein [Ilumatobacteraceae bacterium]